MFNNPFDSFQNTVAKAKEEREQLDRLLTISTPWERLLVAVIALLSVIFAAWLFFGSVSHSLAVDGVLVEPVEDLPGDSRSVQAVIWIRSDAAAHIRAGMPVAIELDMADGEAGALDGKIAAVSAVALSDELAMVESAAPVSMRRIDIVVDEDLDSASLAGRGCRIVIRLGMQSPVALFRTGRS